MNLPRLEPFRPRLWHELQSYSLGGLGRDVGAGVTVGVVALPLAMAFADAARENALEASVAWRLRQESNLYLALRRRSFYPLISP